MGRLARLSIGQVLFEEFEIRPVLGDLDWMEGDVPTPHGMIHVKMNRQEVSVLATEGSGWLYVDGQKVRVETNKTVTISLCP